MARILVAEDHEDNRLLVGTLLRSLGFEYDLVENGLEAVGSYDRAVMERRPYDLLLLDAMMPDKTGYEVAWHVRRSDQETPIVIMTALKDPLMSPHAVHVRANDVIYKPFDADELAGKIHEHVNSARVLTRFA